MDRHALDVLELPAIRERLADETSFAGGRALVEALEPSSDRAEVADRQARTAEAIRLHDAGPPRLGGAEDVRTAAAHAARGGVLTPSTLAAVAATDPRRHRHARGARAAHRRGAAPRRHARR